MWLNYYICELKNYLQKWYFYYYYLGYNIDCYPKNKIKCEKYD